MQRNDDGAPDMTRSVVMLKHAARHDLIKASYTKIENIEYRILDGHVNDFTSENIVSMGAHPSHTREYLLLSPQSAFLNAQYNLLRNRITHLNEMEILRVIIPFVRESFSYDSQDTENLTNRFSQFTASMTAAENAVPAIPLDEFIIHKLGVCRHHALFTAYSLDKLKKDKLLMGDIHHHRANMTRNGHTAGHVWVIYHSNITQKLYLIDSFWNEDIFDLTEDREKLHGRQYSENILKECEKRYNPLNGTHIEYFNMPSHIEKLKKTEHDLLGQYEQNHHLQVTNKKQKKTIAEQTKKIAKQMQRISLLEKNLDPSNKTIEKYGINLKEFIILHATSLKNIFLSSIRKFFSKMRDILSLKPSDFGAINSLEDVEKYAMKNKNSRTAHILEVMQLTRNISVDTFKSTYLDHYNNTLFKNPFSKMYRRLQEKTELSLNDIQQHAIKNFNSKTVSVLRSMKQPKILDPQEFDNTVEEFRKLDVNSHAFKEFDITTIRCLTFNNTILLHAIASKDTEIISKLLQHPQFNSLIDISDTGNIAKNSPLLLAIKSNMLDLAIELLNRGAAVHQCDASGHTALHYACLFRYNDVITLLLDRGADKDKLAESSTYPEAYMKHDATIKISPSDLYCFDFQSHHLRSDVCHFAIFSNVHDHSTANNRNWNLHSLLRLGEKDPALEKRMNKPIPSTTMLQMGQWMHTDYFGTRVKSLYNLSCITPESLPPEFIQAVEQEKLRLKTSNLSPDDRIIAARNKVIAEFENREIYTQYHTVAYYQNKASIEMASTSDNNNLKLPQQSLRGFR